MVLIELVETALELVAEHVGLNGLAVGSLAIAVVALWYLREAADVFVVLARWSRMLSIVGLVLLVALVVGIQFGIVDLSSSGSLIGQLIDLAGEVL